jgi:soluble cytochrome b562
MKHLRLPLLLSAAALVAGLALTARARAHAASPAPAAPVLVDGDEALEQAMEDLKKNLKMLSQSVGDAARNEESLRALQAMQGSVLKAKLTSPPHAEKLPAGEQAKFKSDFRRDLCKALADLVQVEIEVLEGKNDAAKKRLAENVVAFRDASHAKYDPE